MLHLPALSLTFWSVLLHYLKEIELYFSNLNHFGPYLLSHFQLQFCCWFKSIVHLLFFVKEEIYHRGVNDFGRKVLDFLILRSSPQYLIIYFCLLILYFFQKELNFIIWVLLLHLLRLSFSFYPEEERLLLVDLPLIFSRISVCFMKFHSIGKRSSVIIGHRPFYIIIKLNICIFI